MSQCSIDDSVFILLAYDALIVFDAARTTFGGSARLMARKGLQLVLPLPNRDGEF